MTSTERTEDVGAVDGDTPAAVPPSEDDAANTAALARHGFVPRAGEITRARAPRPSREQTKVALASRVEIALASLVSDLPHVTRRMEEPRALLSDLLAMLLDDADEADHANG
ncbi:MAG TPA: hypothetical protein PLF26_20955 [Blastocatellia bacterium]|nr:hypothetical protein [Blastocatellia bacterium]